MRARVFCAGLGGLLLVMAAPAGAEPSPVAIDGVEPALAEADGGGWTAELTFTNLTTDDVTLGVSHDADDDGCELELSDEEVPRSQVLGVTVTIPAGCEVGDDGIDFAVTATGADDAEAVFDITAAPKPEPQPDWDVLRAFPIALAVLLVAVALLFGAWWVFDAQTHTPGEELTHLDKTWSFAESWVGNVTVGAGLLTGVFGTSDVVTAFLGKDAESSLALATVGSAMAVALIAAAPLVLSAVSGTSAITAAGLLVASAFTLAGAFGEIYVVVRVAEKLDLGGWEDDVQLLGLAAAALLVVYAVRVLWDTLEQGTTPPPPAPPAPVSDTIVAARMIVEALKAQDGADSTGLDEYLAPYDEAYPTVPAGPATSPGDDRPRRRTALL